MEHGHACDWQAVRNAGPDFRRNSGQKRGFGERQCLRWGAGEFTREGAGEEEEEGREGGSCCLRNTII